VQNIFQLFRKSGASEVAAGICVGVVVAAAVLVSARMSAAESASAPVSAGAVVSAPAKAANRAARNIPRFADLRGEQASNDVRYIADWVADSRDAGDKPFVIIDKKGAKVFVFDQNARLRGAAPVLLGLATGDDSVPGIGSKPLSDIAISERTTPAGRFVGERGHNARGEDVVWVDYDAAVSMHRVLTTNRAERRLERLATPSTEDNRVSFGCINVPIAFYEQFIRPTFAADTANIYVLPETRPVRQVFAAYDVAAAHGIYRNHAQKVPDSDALMILLFALRAN
jgi:hypothetical protein